MEDKVCRTCLGRSSLNPIFVNPEEHDRYSTAIYVTAGIKVTPNDGLPQDMCTKCITFLNKALEFREKCRDTDFFLLKMKNISEYVTLNTGICKDVIETKDLEFNNDNDEVIKLTETVAVSIKVEGEYLDDPDHNKDHNELLMGCRGENEESDVIDDTVFIAKGNQENFTIKNEYSEIIIPTRNIEIKKTYLDVPGHDLDDDKLLIDFRDENEDSDVINNISEIKESQEDVNIKNKESEIIIPTVPTRRVLCQFCSKNLSIRSLKEHIAQQHPGADDRTVKCALCDRYVMRAKMERHKKMKHGDGGTLRCGYCKTEYDDEELLIAHVSTCVARKKKQSRRDESTKELAECHICHKSMLKLSLRSHVAFVHEGKGPVCEHCGHRFANNHRLAEHRRARHGHDKFRCGQCAYQSASLLAMKNHERRHRGERPFVCEACGRSFHSLHLLRQHRQSHRTEKQIKCDLCPAIFKANNSLHVHKMTCHSRATFRCRLCARTFSCKNYATRHIKHVHSVKETASALERVSSDTEIES